MEFNVEEKGELLHLYPMNTEKWMVIRGHGSMPWKLYKKTNDGHSYIDEYLKLTDACRAGSAL